MCGCATWQRFWADHTGIPLNPKTMSYHFPLSSFNCLIQQPPPNESLWFTSSIKEPKSWFYADDVGISLFCCYLPFFSPRHESNPLCHVLYLSWLWLFTTMTRIYSLLVLLHSPECLKVVVEGFLISGWFVFFLVLHPLFGFSFSCESTPIP